MRTFILAVTGFVLSVAACSSYGTSVVEVEKTRAAVASVSLSIPRSLVAGQTARAVANHHMGRPTGRPYFMDPASARAAPARFITRQIRSGPRGQRSSIDATASCGCHGRYSARV